MAFWGRSRRAAGAATSLDAGFDAAAYARLASRVDSALTRARASGRPVVAAVTAGLPGGVDPLAHIAAARSEGEPWASFAQSAHDGFALATLGVAAQVISGGDGRFDAVAEGCGAVLEAAEVDDLAEDPDAPPGSGVIWVGGFSFYDEGPWSDAWRESPGIGFVLPSVSISSRGGADAQARMTVAVAVQPDSDAAQELAAVESLVERLRLDEDLGGREFVARPGAAEVNSTAPPEHYERAVAEAAGLIQDGEFEKIVLAREIVLRRDSAIDPVNALRGLQARFPECTSFALGHNTTTFIGASPELLIRREGRRASTMALAGSMRRGGDPETDDLLGRQLLEDEKNRTEHEIVVRRIERTLGRLSAWVAVGEHPELVKVKNIQHLATPIRAQLTEPRPVIELAGMLHPTPAVGGEPWPEAAVKIRELEGLDRGWYTGGVGWMDLFEDGEFHVALRSALIDGPQARLFAGAGIVGDSDPAAELAETETKFAALLPVLRES